MSVPAPAALLLPLVVLLAAWAVDAVCEDGLYSVAVDFRWSPATDRDFPDEAGVEPGFSRFLCAVHNEDFVMWAPDEVASSQLKMLAETGNTLSMATLLAERKETGEVFVYKDLPVALNSQTSEDSEESPTPAPSPDPALNLPPSISSTESLNFQLEVDGARNQTLLTCIASIIPSPDFFIGFVSYQLCSSTGQFFNRAGTNSLNLVPWDAGTTEGDSYTSVATPRDPPLAVKQKLAFLSSFGRVALDLVGNNSSKETGVTSPEDSSGAACFPASQTIALAASGQSDAAELPMHAVRVGHALRGGLGDGDDRVFFMSHADADVISTFVQLETATTSIRLSPGHYIHTMSDSGKASLVAADTVRVGEFLVSGTDGTPLRVTGVSHVRDRGLYNPHTRSGNLVVSGVLVSCYTRAVRPALAHALLRPLMDRPWLAETVGDVLAATHGTLVLVLPILGGIFAGPDFTHA